MAKWKITAKAECSIIYVIEADTEELALKEWEDTICGGTIDENSIDTEEFESCEEIPQKAPEWKNTPLGKVK